MTLTAWFNLGSNLVALGRTKEAGQAYDRAPADRPAVADALVSVRPVPGVL